MDSEACLSTHIQNLLFTQIVDVQPLGVPSSFSGVLGRHVQMVLKGWNLLSAPLVFRGGLA